MLDLRKNFNLISLVQLFSRFYTRRKSKFPSSILWKAWGSLSVVAKQPVSQKVKFLLDFREYLARLANEEDMCKISNSKSTKKNTDRARKVIKEFAEKSVWKTQEL